MRPDDTPATTPPAPDARAGGTSRWGMRVLLFAPVALAALLALGFGLFCLTAGTMPDEAALRADGIVVLTGGSDRIDKAMELLAEKRANRLLISGVHPQTTEHQLQQLTGADKALFECCVDLDRTALDTRGNAEETKRWAEANGFKSLIVVTSDYHMPRALLEFARRMPDVDLKPYPVEAETGSLRLWLSEYAKYLLAWLRVPIEREHQA